MYNARVMEFSSLKEAKKELKNIGAYSKGAGIMAPKAVHRLLRLENVGIKEALIVKQEMLSVGGEASVAKGIGDLSQHETDVLLMGTQKQLKQAVGKLSIQPFKCPKIAEEIVEALDNYTKDTFTLKAADRKLRIDRPFVMGVVNVTPDSFSDGGEFLDAEAAIAQAMKLERDGADIIDIGGESSRPGSKTLPAREELERIVPVIEGIVDCVKIPISVDTCKPGVARKVLDMGAHMINDIAGLKNSKMTSLLAESGAGVVVMHMQETPKTMQKNPTYDDVVADITRFLRETVERAVRKGIDRDSIIIDPGLGFGKTVDHNLEIVSRLKEFRSLGLPVLVGASRKSFIGKILDRDVDERLSGSLAMLSMCIQNGARVVRVHDVKESVDVVRMTWAALQATV